MRRVAAIAVVITVAAGGCSSSNDGSPTTPAVSTPVTATVSTSTSRSTSSTTTTSTSTTSTTTTTTTTTAVADRTADVEAAFLAYHEAYVTCFQTPTTCVIDFAAEEGPAKENLTTFLAELISRGWYVAPGNDLLRIVIEDVTLSTPTTSIVTSCIFDSGVVLGPDGPDGQPTVVNDQAVSKRFRDTLYLENGEWLLGSGEEVAILGDGDRCDG